jgi:hypothetical protein
MVEKTYSEAEVAAAIAKVLHPEWAGEDNSRESVIRELLMFLPNPPEPEAAREAARMLFLDGQI